MEFYAHSIEGKPVEEWHRLEEYEGTFPDLRKVVGAHGYAPVVESGLSLAKRNVANFAAEFGCGGWGYLAWLWQGGNHD